jgi:hypothetical protein
MSAPLSLTNARKPGRAAQLARSGKETKYKAACDANGLELLPICIESTGACWGKACDDFFKKVLKVCAVAKFRAVTTQVGAKRT